MCCDFNLVSLAAAVRVHSDARGEIRLHSDARGEIALHHRGVRCAPRRRSARGGSLAATSAAAKRQVTPKSRCRGALRYLAVEGDYFRIICRLLNMFATLHSCPHTPKLHHA